MTNSDRIMQAASRAEELAIELKEAVTDLRETDNMAYAYARVYHLRTELGRIVAMLGWGPPERHARKNVKNLQCRRSHGMDALQHVYAVASQADG
jgi:hypothetical protein